MSVKLTAQTVTACLAMLVSACAPTDSSTDTSVSSSLVSTTTSLPAVPTTEEVARIELAEFSPPTEVLSSFDFRLFMLDMEDEPFGIVSGGVFVAPDAVSCDAGNPSFVSPSLGVGTAIGTQFWFDDGFFADEPSGRSEEFAVEWLSGCPGAPEYWDTPIFLDDRFSSHYDGPGEEIGGFETWIYALSSNSTDLELDDGRVWLTEAGWPIKTVITGSVMGGVFSFFDFDGDGSSEELAESMVPFEIELEITGADGAQVVRAPDGSLTVGPLNDPVVSVASPPQPSPSLATAMEYAYQTPCYELDTLTSLITVDELDSLRVSQINQLSGSDSGITTVTPGMAGGGLGNQVSSSAVEDLASIHAEILFNHRAPLIGLFDWLDWVPPDMERDGKPHLTLVAPRGADVAETSVIASWNGEVVTYGDGTGQERTYHVYLAVPESGQRLAAADETEVASILADWRSEATDAAGGVLEQDLQGAINLEFIYQNRDSVKQQACALLFSAWARSDAAIKADVDATSALVEEAAAQHLLLALEYLDLLGGYLDQPEIDWLRTEGVDFSTGFVDALDGDTPGFVITFWTDLFLEALTFSDPAFYG